MIGKFSIGTVGGKRLPSFGFVTATAISGFILIQSAVSAPQYETAPIFKASRILPEASRKGPNFTVDEKVVNDGYMNHYTIASRFGEFTPDSTAELQVRLAEINAIAELEKVKDSETFQEGAGEKAQDIGKGAKALVTDPLGTAQGAVSGVGAIFRRGAESLSGDPASDYEDSRLESVIGLSKAKRELAQKLRVDPYSTNQALQRQLEEVARADYAGGLVTGTLLSLIPVVGIGVSVAGGTELVLDQVYQQPPTDLRRMNREKLQAMKINPHLVDLFMGNTHFSPTQQTALVGALAEMTDVANRDEVIKQAIPAENEDQARFRLLQVALYAAYHKHVEPVERFLTTGTLPGVRTRRGAIVLLVPVDYLAWTKEMAAIAQAATGSLGSDGNSETKHIGLAGKSSELAKRSLSALGWTVQENAATQLLPPQ